MANKVHIDIESYSEVDLKTRGVYVYAEHPSTEVLCVCYAFNNEPVQTFVPGRDELPQKLYEHVKAGKLVHAYNANFERVVLNGVAGKKINFPEISINQTRCTMLKSRVAGLPGSLKGASDAFGTHPKSDTGHGVMLQLARPRKGKIKRYTPENEPEKFEQLYSYCVDDVEAERDLDTNLPDLTDSELRIYRFDQRMNDRGVLVDDESIEHAQYLVEQYKLMLAQYCYERTGLRLSQTAKLADWIRQNGYPTLENLQAPTIAEALKDSHCPPRIRKLLQCFSTYNMKAVTKLAAMQRMRCADGRLRGAFMIYGAGPGRWSSRNVQLQNLMRSVIKDTDEAIDAMHERSLNWLRWLYAGVDVMKVIASCVRGMLWAPRGRKLMAYDFAQIESRIQAWLAGAEWKLEHFRTGKHKIYKVTGSMMFGIPPEDVVDVGENQLYTAAKIGELACIAENQLVLTDAGLVPIQNVSLDMKVWDGFAFVSHDGVIDKGVREVITYDGLTATKDHIVWTKEAGPIQLGIAAATGKSLTKSGSGWRAIRSGQNSLAGTSLQQALATLLRFNTMRRVWYEAMVRAEKSRSEQKQRMRLMRAKESTLSVSEMVGSTVNRSEATLHQPERLQLQKLRRAWNRISIQIYLRSRQIRQTISWFTSSFGIGSSRRERSLRTGELALCNASGTAIEPSRFTNDGGRLRMGANTKPLRFSHITSIITRLFTRRTNRASERRSAHQSEELAPDSEAAYRARTFDIVNAGPRNRFTVSNVLVHNCGYQGWAGAIMKFARDMGIKLSIEPEEIGNRWREANREQVKLWAELLEAARFAVENPGRAYGIRNKKIMFKVEDRWLMMRLPSGRRIYYLDPKMRDDQVTYMGIDTYTRRWMRVETYGGKLLQNCLAGDTLVLTSRGWIPIAKYTNEPVWDGFEWAQPARLAYQGEQTTINVAGVRMTPNHKVLTNEGWKTASSCEGLSWSSVCLPDGVTLRPQYRRQNLLDRAMRLWRKDPSSGGWVDAFARTIAKVLRVHDEKVDRREEHDTRFVGAPHTRGVGQYGTALYQTKSRSLAQLRRTWNYSVRTLVQVREFCQRYVRLLQAWVVARSNQQRSWLLAEQLPMGYAQTTSAQHAMQSDHRNTGRQNDDSRGQRTFRDSSGHATLARGERLAEGAIVSRTELREPVYDLVNAGPRQRFTILTDRGPAIVHNCCEGIGRDLLVAGLLNMDEAGYETIMTVHDEGVFEVDEGFGSDEEARTLMTKPLAWADGLPVKCDGWIKQRYRK